MSEKIRFLVYCAEIYKREKHLTGRQMYSLFSKYNVWDYVYECYDALHTTGALYTIENIDEFIANSSYL
ncbi:hypothetical protein FACS1894190_10000 [Spirochaetia bacterium]|nr:hypothetical protein FACS1894190_10000 [Spirochaetia bacterium]